MIDSRPSFKINAGIRDVDIHPLAKRVFVNRSFQQTRKVDELLGKRPSSKRKLGDIAPRRFVDFDTLEQELEKREGIKVRAGPETTKGLASTVTNAINAASTAQIRALADTIGVPITLGIADMKDMIGRFFSDLDDGVVKPSLDQQTKILQVLTDIRDKDGGPPIEEKGSLVTSDLWTGMSPGDRTILLKDAAARFLSAGRQIKEGTNAQDLDDSWRFITSDDKKISIRTLKTRMNKGGYILNLRTFEVTKQAAR